MKLLSTVPYHAGSQAGNSNPLGRTIKIKVYSGHMIYIFIPETWLNFIRYVPRFEKLAIFCLTPSPDCDILSQFMNCSFRRNFGEIPKKNQDNS